MLAGIYYGAQYGGSITAILINLPGEASSAVTAIDGYRMAQQGHAGSALAIAAFGSFFAGTVATVVIAVFAPLLTAVALEFNSPEYFSLMVLGLVMSVTLAQGSIINAVAMVVIGLLLGTVGTDIYTGLTRFTLGRPELRDGLDFVAIAVAMFGIAEIIRNLENESNRNPVIQSLSSLLPSRAEMREAIGPIVRGTVLGSAIGVLPGASGSLASFTSYTLEKRLSRSPKRFGNGAIEGVAGPESANNAAAQTGFIPLLTLGIPANPNMALMIGALIIQGIVPGPKIVTEQPNLFWGLIASMWVGNLILVLLNIPLIGLWVRLLKVPYYILTPIVVAFAVIGAYSINNQAFDLYSLVFFGAAGYALVRLGCEPAPLLLGFVLGPMLEENLRRSMLISEGDASIFISSPISVGLLMLALAVLIATALPLIRRRRAEIFQEG
jgi:TctA family transporter